MRKKQTKKQTYKREAVDLEDVLAELTVASNSGVYVNLRAILGNPPVRRALDLITGKVSIMPLYPYTMEDDGSKTIYKDHQSYPLLARSPSPLFTPSVVKRKWVFDYLIYGTSYSYIVRDANGKPTELLLLDPAQSCLDGSTGELMVNTIVGNPYVAPQYSKLLPLEDVFILKGLGDGYMGYSLLTTGRDALANGLTLQQYGMTHFKNNATGRVFIQPGDAVKGQAKITEFKTQFLAMYAGVENAGKIGFLPPGAEVKNFAADNEASQYLQSKEHDLISIANLFNLPGSKTGSKNNTSYGSLEQDERSVLSDTLEPILHAIEEEAFAKLATEEEKRTESVVFSFDRSGLLQIDVEKEHSIIRDDLTAGLISWEEARVKMGMSTEKTGSLLEPPPAPPIPEVAPQQAPQQDNQSNLIRSLAKTSLNRLVKRIEKSVVEGKKLDVLEHKEIFLEALEPFERCEQFTTKFLTDLKAEIDNTLPELHTAVFKRIDINTLTEALCK